jgi:hypothetical protein
MSEIDGGRLEVLQGAAIDNNAVDTCRRESVSKVARHDQGVGEPSTELFKRDLFGNGEMQIPFR